MSVRGYVRQIFEHFGYEIRRNSHPEGLGIYPFRDMQRLIKAPSSPIVFDVGANVGQTVESFRGHFSNPIIHSFEPAEDPFRELAKRTSGLPNCFINNFALGAQPGVKDFCENSTSEMSSLLELDTDGWGDIQRRRQISLSTIDAYCASKNIDHIDILKTDTQGYDLEVIKGAEEMVKRKRIRAVFLEIILNRMYRNLPTLDHVYRYLTDRGFVLVCFYPCAFQNNFASWMDALFIHPGYSCDRRIGN